MTGLTVHRNRSDHLRRRRCSELLLAPHFECVCVLIPKASTTPPNSSRPAAKQSNSSCRRAPPPRRNGLRRSPRRLGARRGGGRGRLVVRRGEDLGAPIRYSQSTSNSAFLFLLHSSMATWITVSPYLKKGICVRYTNTCDPKRALPGCLPHQMNFFWCQI